MANNQTQAVATTANQGMVARTVKELLSSDNYKARFNEVLGKKANGYISSIIAVSNQPTLRNAKPETVIAASMIAATLDLPINQSLGYAYIVAYKGEAQFQMGYKGFIQLAERSGQYEIINTTDIREGEIVDEDLVTGEMQLKKLSRDERSKAKVVGYLAHIRLMNGFHKSLFMTNEELLQHAKRYSTSYQFDKNGSSLWSTQFDSMAKKTVLKLLLSKYGLLSIEMQTAIKFDQASVKMDDNCNIEEATPIYVDNQPAEFEEVETAADQAAAKATAIAAAAETFNKK